MNLILIIADGNISQVLSTKDLQINFSTGWCLDMSHHHIFMLQVKTILLAGFTLLCFPEND